MFNLLMTIFSSTAIALILKYNESRAGNRWALLSGNYLTALVLLAIQIILHNESVPYSESLVGWAGIVSLGFVAGFYIFSKAVSLAGAALASVSARISLFFPVILSAVFFHEFPNLPQFTGLLLALITVLFFSRSIESPHPVVPQTRSWLILVVLFLLIGFNDFSLKLFRELRLPSEKEFFLFLVFSFSFLWSVNIAIRKNQLNDRRAFITGLVLGIPNLASSWFMLAALDQLPALIVFPVINAGVIILTAVLSALIWREHLNHYGKLALLTGIFTVILLSLK